jgi:ABC-type multidrug transport system fused ATPase/permease subunit
MIFAVVLYNPLIAVSSIFIFFLVALLMYSILNTRIRRISLKSTKASIESNMKILEVLDTYRESVVRNTRHNYVSSITKLRAEISESVAAQAIMPNISKYAMELTVILGAVGVAAIQFILFDANQAIAGLSLFVAVGFRISPAFLRVQQNLMSFRLNQTWANETIRIFSDIPDMPSESLPNIKIGRNEEFVPEISVKEVSFSYGLNSDFSLNQIDIHIPAGAFVAVVGSSGSGKTTFVDLLLGLLTPTFGEINISGELPTTVHKKWPGIIAYVPQDVVVINDTVIENIGLGFASKSIDPDKIQDCLRMAHLEEVIEDLPQKLNEKLGEKGSRLSGGQRQRIGIARALYTSPKILVLDEATSSLDSESEREINNSLDELKGKLTLIVIAHRLPSVINADLVVYFENGQIEAIGTFEEVRRKSAKFNNQALLMGL